VADGQDRGTNRPHVIVLADAETVLGDTIGTCQSASGYEWSPTTLRRLLCDAIVQTVWTDEKGVPLAMGRAARTFTPDQFRALIVRDGGCRFPGCDVAPEYCEAHHHDPWEHGGATDLGNGMLICRGRGHHRYLHEGHGRVEGNPNGRLDFYARDGTHLGHTEPRQRPKPIRLFTDAHDPPPGRAA
jgi:hypothetical protein